MGKGRKISKEKGLQIVIDLMFAGKVRKEIVQFFATDYEISDSTIDKWMKAARPKVTERYQEAEAIRARETDATISSAVKEGLLSDIEIELILCKIISAEFRVEEWVKGDLIIRNVVPAEQIAAARTIYLRRGSNAPTKVATTDTKGNDVRPFNVTLNLG